MEKSEIKGFIAKRCAKELKNGDVVNLGIGLPTLIPNYLPKDVELIIHAELGIVSAGKSPKEGDDKLRSLPRGGCRWFSLLRGFRRRLHRADHPR